MAKSRNYRKYEGQFQIERKQEQIILLFVLRLFVTVFAAWTWKENLSGALKAILDMQEIRGGTVLFLDSVKVSMTGVVDVLEKSVGTGRMSFSVEMLLTIGVALILFGLLWCRRLRFLAAILFLFPSVMALTLESVPPEKSCYLLILAAGMYFAVGIPDGKTALTQTVITGCVMAALLLTVGRISPGLETLKENENGIYLQTRRKIETEYIGGIQDWIEKMSEKQEEESEQEETEKVKAEKGETEQEKTDEKEQAAGQEETAEQVIVEPGQTMAAMPWADTTGSGAVQQEDAGDEYPVENIARYAPGDGEGFYVTRQEKPRESVYYARGYGDVYRNNMWKAASEARDTVEKRDIYRSFPENMERLIALCEKETEKEGELTLQKTSAFISRQFKENTVYNYEPGAVPEGKDFAEYFLFENQKGFCVHFATTAALMYRICGFESRYAYGYVIPDDTFTLQDDGSYRAYVSGDMGHAWCEVYEDGGWTVKEHTLPYVGTESRPERPAAAAGGKTWQRNMAGRVILAGKVLVVSVVVVLLIGLGGIGQALIRRQILSRRFMEVKNGAGIQRVYRCLCEETMEKRVANREELLSEEIKNHMINRLPEELHGEIEWLYRLVMETLFYECHVTRKDTKRAVNLYRRAQDALLGELSVWKKIWFRYVKVF